MSRDRVLEAFLQAQHRAAQELNQASELVQVHFADPQHALLLLTCRGLIRDADGEVREASHFLVGIYFPENYLREVNPYEVLTWMGPPSVFHPNISDKAPFICAGRLRPGTPLEDLVFQVFDIVTYNKLTMREDDALNHAACAWARQNLHRFPVDRRPLKWKAPRPEVAA